MPRRVLELVDAIFSRIGDSVCIGINYVRFMPFIAKIRHTSYPGFMPHQRPRHLLDLLEKRLTLFPVVGVLGARQTGKSTLLRDLLSLRRPIRYVTLDREEMKVSAQRQPSLFVQNLEADAVQTVCIDEIQKAPGLFDTLKAEVDERKRPGRFAVSGSTEFSKKTGIQDALTGRIALLRMFPLNQAEIDQRAPRFPMLDPFRFARSQTHTPSLKEIQRWLDRGGMPGFFSVREEPNRAALFDSWIETTCTRDLARFEIPRFNPELARRILLETARVEVPTRTEIARAVGKTPRQIEAYLSAFKAIFVVYEVEPYKTSVGKPHFYWLDAGLAGYAGASVERRLQVWFLNECLSQFSYSGQMRPDLFIYETSRGSRIDFVVEAKDIRYAVKLSHDEAPGTYELRSVEAFRRKHPKISMVVAAPCLQVLQPGEDPGVKIVPWSVLT